MSAIIGTPPAPPLQRIGQLEKLILAGEGGFACGGVIGKDVISPAELALTMTFPPTCDIIETFMRTANPSPFGKGGETVLDAGYRNAREFKPPHFALSSDLIGVGGILASISTQLGLKEPIYATLNKINAYPTGGFFKAHRDTPLGKDHLGTITVCLPVPFTGGDLVVKQDQRTKTFAWEAAQDGLIEWAFLYSDCEHEVLPVTSGTRVTIAYDVWWCGDITAKDASKLGIDRSPIYKYLQALLDDKTHFLPKGGKIGFGMRHAYPVENTDEIPAKLKGVDRTVQLALLSLGLKWEIKAAYDYIYDYFGESSQESNDDMSVDGSDADAADNGDEPEHTEKDDSDIIEKVRDEDIISLRTTGYRHNVFCGNHPKWVQGADTESTDLYDVLTEEENAARRATDIIWITQVGAYGCESSYMAYGNEHTMDTLYSGACIIVTIPPAANRS